jgi:hypothetical protein
MSSTSLIISTTTISTIPVENAHLSSLQLPVGSFLFMVLDNTNHVVKDGKSKFVATESEHTGKTGVCFYTYPGYPVCTAIETNTDVKIGLFQITRPIKLYIGEYTFRSIHPDRYFDLNGEFILNVKVLPDENINHAEGRTLPIITDPSFIEHAHRSRISDLDVCITNETDLASLVYVKQITVTKETANSTLISKANYNLSHTSFFNLFD